MITPSFSLTATERVLPKLALDFTTATLDSRVTFTRTTGVSNPATYVNSSGVITAAINNEPRFDFDPVTLQCKGLLIEESRTNLKTSSEDFTGTGWSAYGAAVSVNATNAPDGNTTANKVIVNLGLQTNPQIQGTVTGLTAVSQPYTISLFVKKAETRYINFAFWYSATYFSGIQFDFDTGLITRHASAGANYVISSTSATAFGNGWYRITITSTINHTSAFPSFIGTNTLWTTGAPLVNITGDGTSGVYVWGDQLEAGAFATSYIPTTTTALTRNADVATMTGTNFSDWYNATAGSANVSVTSKSISGTRPLFQMDDNTTNNIISLRGNVANPELYIKATTDQVQLDAGTIVANTAYNLAGAWNTNDCAAVQNGAAVVTDTSATIPTVTQARIGSDGTNYANGWLQKINYWPQRITDNETQAFSK